MFDVHTARRKSWGNLHRTESKSLTNTVLQDLKRNKMKAIKIGNNVLFYYRKFQYRYQFSFDSNTWYGDYSSEENLLNDLHKKIMDNWR